MQRSIGGHVLPLGPLALVLDLSSGGVEQLEQQGIVHFVLVEAGVALVVVQGLPVHPVVDRVEVQAQPAQNGVDPLCHGPLVRAGLQLPQEGVGGVEVHGPLKLFHGVEVPGNVLLGEDHALAGLHIAREPLLGGHVIELAVVYVVDVE